MCGKLFRSVLAKHKETIILISCLSSITLRNDKGKDSPSERVVKIINDFKKMIKTQQGDDEKDPLRFQEAETLPYLSNKFR